MLLTFRTRTPTSHPERKVIIYDLWVNYNHYFRHRFYLFSKYTSVHKDVSHGEPDVLDLDCLVEKLLPLASPPPSPPQPVVRPGPLHVHCGGVRTFFLQLTQSNRRRQHSDPWPDTW